MPEQNNTNKRRTNRQQPVDTTYGHLQPQALEVEKAVLGALLIDKDAYAVVCEMLFPESFYEPRNQMVYSAIRDLSMEERPVDMLTVTDQLSKKGQLDNGYIFILLTDWAEPFVVDPPESLVDFDNDPAIIGYGKLVFDKEMTAYEKFRIDIKYRNERKPKYIVIVASSSSLGDHFTGASGSLLYLDEFSLAY